MHTKPFLYAYVCKTIEERVRCTLLLMNSTTKNKYTLLESIYTLYSRLVSCLCRCRLCYVIKCMHIDIFAISAICTHYFLIYTRNSNILHIFRFFFFKMIKWTSIRRHASELCFVLNKKYGNKIMKINTQNTKMIRSCLLRHDM